MSREKQIDEMAKLICNFPQCINYNSIGECKPTECQIADKAEALYNAGYRKQSDLTPCDACRFNPPTSRDNAPCTICPAQAK